MCGIAGLISNTPEGRIEPMLAAIEHRGRDDQGVYVSQPFGDGQRACLGHRRLSIIDTSAAGHQPFISEDKRYALTYNGEIYNYQDIREELEAKGEKFSTATDTEVLLKAYRMWGERCLDRLNGMFAFAIWDDQEKTLFAARDRVGLKPFHYAVARDSFIFASEIKAILASGMIDAELDPQGFDQFLTFLWPAPPHTMFRGVFQLLPGHFLVWKNGAIATKQYWDLDFSVEERGGSEREWANRVAATLERVTKLEMISDVPLGAFLSGGIDSTSIVAFMSRHSKSKVSTYTTAISADDLAFDIIPDDVEWARRAAKLFPVDYHETLLQPNIADLLPKLVWHSDAPVIDMAIPSYLISEQSRATQKVMLSGMGGDEIFAGYPRQLAMQIAGVTDIVPSAVRRPLMRTVESTLYGGSKGRLTAPLRNAKKFAKSAAMDFEERYLGFGTYFTSAMKSKLLSSSMHDATTGFDAYEYHKKYFANCRDAAPINRLLYVDFKTFMPALNLDTTDRTSMAANLEVRAPFLNRELVELSARIPASLKIKGLKRKYIFKKAMESVLPKDLIWRRKAGFGAPIRSWLRGGLRSFVHDHLSPETIKRRGLFSPEEVGRIISLNESGREDMALQVFQLLTLEIWFKEFIDKKRV
ncbi:MAG: asparagine synthase (glutamine-hydrolyzing) [Pyrinomonadaceae bacterium]